MNTDVMFSSQTDLWSTPQDTFDALNAEFKFELDACAIAENAKCAKFFTIADDGLKQYWHSEPVRTIWCNPPYGRTIAAWVKKAYETSRMGDTVVCLLPARTDTAWWQ